MRGSSYCYATLMEYRRFGSDVDDEEVLLPRADLWKRWMDDETFRNNVRSRQVTPKAFSQQELFVIAVTQPVAITDQVAHSISLSA